MDLLGGMSSIYTRMEGSRKYLKGTSSTRERAGVLTAEMIYLLLCEGGEEVKL